MWQVTTPRAIPGSGQDSSTQAQARLKTKTHYPPLGFFFICLRESNLSLFSLFPPLYYSSQEKALSKVCTSMHRFTHLHDLSPSCPEASKPTSTKTYPPASALRPSIPKETQSNIHLPRNCLITRISKHLPMTIGQGGQLQRRKGWFGPQKSIYYVCWKQWEKFIN